MQKPAVEVCPEGWPFICVFAFSALIFAMLDYAAAALVFWLLALFALYFFRDPVRVIAEGLDLAVSPADGKIVAIGLRRNPFTGDEVQCISIFMSVFNVHVNRTPVAATVKAISYIPGKFFNASLDKASTDNERCLWNLEDASGQSWAMTQIAGLIARRIVARAQLDDKLGRGEKIGMIRFGSRVDLYLAPGYLPSVDPGAKVYGGQTVIARKS